MTSKTHYATLGVTFTFTATQDQIKRAYRKLARRFHPSASQESVAEKRPEDLAAARESEIDPARSQRYDAALVAAPAGGQLTGLRQAGWQPGFAGADDASIRQTFRDFFTTTAEHWRVPGEDQQGVILVELADACRGVTLSLNLQLPAFDRHGSVVFLDRRLEVCVPKGVLDGQRLRLKGLGAAGQDGVPAGDLYLEVIFLPHPLFRLDKRDVYIDVPVSPWEAMLGATVMVCAPTGPVPLNIPPGSAARRRLPLKGLGLPGSPPGDLYAVLDVVLPPGDSAATREAWKALASAFPDYRPRD